jgi:hypothetical protein
MNIKFSDTNEKENVSSESSQESETIEKLEEQLKIVVGILNRSCPDYRDWLETHYKKYL